MSTATDGSTLDPHPPVPPQRRISPLRVVVILAVSIVVAAMLAFGFWAHAMNEAFKNQNNECPQGTRTGPHCDDGAIGAAFYGAYAASEVMDQAKELNRAYPTEAQLARHPSVLEKIGAWQGTVRVISSNSKARTYCLSVTTVDNDGAHAFYIPTDETILAPDIALHKATSPTTSPCT